MKIKTRFITHLPSDAVCVESTSFYRVYHSKKHSTRVYWLWNDGSIESF